jgi:hypothetical protein
MASLRSRCVDETLTPWYHCISRCVRRLSLCGGQFVHRKQWIEDRLRELVGIFSVECAGFAVMDNHLHLLLRLDSRKAERWSEDEVVRRWFCLFPLRDTAGAPLQASAARIRLFAADSEWVEKIRRRLANLGWFMKCLKEPLARKANREDGNTGALWEARYKSIAVHDEASLIATAAYIDLNPLAAGVAPTPEKSHHTSLRIRLDHCQINGTIQSLRDDLATLSHNSEQELGLWLLPVADDRPHGADRPGLIVGGTLSHYLRVIDAASRMIRDGKANLDPRAIPIFRRLGVDTDVLEATVAKLFEPRARIANSLGKKAGTLERERTVSRSSSYHPISPELKSRREYAI